MFVYVGGEFKRGNLGLSTRPPSTCNDDWILETGKPPRSLTARFGSYPAMFEALIGPGRAYRTFDLTVGELPSSDGPLCEGYVVTGSEAGVYDDRPWIGPLGDFLRAVKGAPSWSASASGTR